MEYKDCLSDMVLVENWRTGHAGTLHVNIALFKRGVCENKIATFYSNKEILYIKDKRRTIYDKFRY